MKFPAVIFDLDGTLLDTLEDMADAMNAFLVREHFPAHPVDAYRYFIGDGLRKLVERALPEDRQDEGLIDRGLDAFGEAYRKNWHDKTRPYDGIPDLLAYLNEKRIQVSVFSNKTDEFTQRIVPHYFPGNRFVVVRGARDDAPRKPSPEVPLAIARTMDTPPERIAYVGDSGTDMQTATAAGMFPFGVSWGFRSVEEIEKNGAAVVLRHPTELLEYF